MSEQDLPCGHDPIEVWDRAADDRLGAHEQSCPYCQGVVNEYRLLSGPTSRWRDQPVDVPASLLERVLNGVRAGLRSRTFLPLVSPNGPVGLDTAAAEAALRWSLDQTDDTRARTCRIRLRPEQPTVEPDGATGDEGAAGDGAPLVDIEITVTARMGADLRSAAGVARELVRAVASDVLGLQAGRIDLHIEDLFVPTARADVDPVATTGTEAAG